MADIGRYLHITLCAWRGEPEVWVQWAVRWKYQTYSRYWWFACISEEKLQGFVQQSIERRWIRLNTHRVSQ